MNSKAILGILCAVIGLLVAINPVASIEVIVILMGIVAVANGISSIVRLNRLALEKNLKRIFVAKSVIGILIGIFAVILPLAMYSFVETVVRIFLYVQAVYLLISAGFIFALILPSENSEQKKSIVLEALFFILAAILLFMLPAGFGVKIMRAAGILLLIFGVILSVAEFRNRPVEVEAEKID